MPGCRMQAGSDIRTATVDIESQETVTRDSVTMAKGITQVLQSKAFPGWEDFEGFIGHIKFVRDHHRKIRKVAFASDSKMASLAPRLATHFVSAEVKSFDYGSYDEALAWLRSESA